VKTTGLCPSVEASELLLMSLKSGLDIISGWFEHVECGWSVRPSCVPPRISSEARPATMWAQHQVLSTIERLAQFSLDHPLILRTRSRLARAIIHRIHLGAAEQELAGDWRVLLEAVLDPKVKISVGHDASAIHGWSVDAATHDSSTVLATGETLHIHGRDSTISRLWSLA
jgi:hypothetical protein